MALLWFLYSTLSLFSFARAISIQPLRGLKMTGKTFGEFLNYETQQKKVSNTTLGELSWTKDERVEERMLDESLGEATRGFIRRIYWREVIQLYLYVKILKYARIMYVKIVLRIIYVKTRAYNVWEIEIRAHYIHQI